MYWQAVDISGARIYRQRTDEIMHSKRVHVRGYLLLDDDYRFVPPPTMLYISFIEVVIRKV
jgi:hypothetical protein